MVSRNGRGRVKPISTGEPTTRHPASATGGAASQIFPRAQCGHVRRTWATRRFTYRESCEGILRRDRPAPKIPGKLCPIVVSTWDDSGPVRPGKEEGAGATDPFLGGPQRGMRGAAGSTFLPHPGGDGGPDGWTPTAPVASAPLRVLALPGRGSVPRPTAFPKANCIESVGYRL